MKFIFSNLGRTLVAVLCVALIIVGAHAYLVPAIGDYFKSTMAKEVSLKINEDAKAPVLNCTNSYIRVNVNDNVNIFSGITARTDGGVNLLPAFRSDYGQPVTERKHVFVYKICDDRSSVLASEIDTTQEGNWVVVFCAKNGNAFSSMKVCYEVFDPEIVIVS